MQDSWIIKAKGLIISFAVKGNDGDPLLYLNFVAMTMFLS